MEEVIEKMDASANEPYLIVILGITGNQGGSVARTFLSNPSLATDYDLRGITRDPDSAASLKLAKQGVEMVKADLNDPASLESAFEGAHMIFSVTNFWDAFFNPQNVKSAEKQGKSLGQLAYEVELQQGRNIADAAAKVPGLERFVVSMLSSPKAWSKGRFSEQWHFESKADMITYIKTVYPDLTQSLRELNMGVYFQSWRHTNLIAPKKSSDGTFVLRMPCKGERPVPFVDPRNDTGLFVHALISAYDHIQIYGQTALLSWRDWLQLWGKVLGKPVRFEEVSVEFYERELAAQGFPAGYGTEIAGMFQWAEEFGYNGNDPECRRIEDVRDTDYDVKGWSKIEDFIRDEDWSACGV